MRKGFTLIELLIVIGILAILATVVVLVLNPAEILAQARDSQRISDLGSVKSSIALYLSTATNASVTSSPNGFTSVSTTAAVICGFVSSTTCTVIPNTGSTVRVNVNSTGWVPVDLTQTSGGSPVSSLPLDPTNGLNGATGYYYNFLGNSTNKTFVLEGKLESAKYSGMMTTDGGVDNNCATPLNNTCWYELGTAPGLNL